MGNYEKIFIGKDEKLKANDKLSQGKTVRCALLAGMRLLDTHYTSKFRRIYLGKLFKFQDE